MTFDAGLLPFLACPVIAELASKVFYSQNIMRISILASTLPPRPVRAFVRHIKIFVALVDKKCLTRIVEHVFNFRNLHTVELDIGDYFSHERARKGFVDTVSSSPPAEFRAKKLVANYYHDWRRQPEEVMWGENQSNNLDMIVLGSLSVTSPDGASVKACWERFMYKEIPFQRAGEHDLKLVGGAGFDENDRSCSRVTRKTVRV
jgi:hypothetical protein